MKLPIVFLLSLAFFGAASAQLTEEKGNPGSLVTPAFRNPFHNHVAGQVGDLLTVIINEQTLSTFAANTQANKNDSTSLNVPLFGDILNRLFGPLSVGASSGVSGSGNTSQNSRMSASMSVIVTEVLPNGHLVIEGRRSLITNKQTQTVVLSGIVRKRDIQPNNTIASISIADAEIRMEGEGMVADRQRKGIITTLLDWLF